MPDTRDHRSPPHDLVSLLRQIETRLATLGGQTDANLAMMRRHDEALFGPDGIMRTVAELKEAQRICTNNQEVADRRRAMQFVVLAALFAGMLTALLTTRIESCDRIIHGAGPRHEQS